MTGLKQQQPTVAIIDGLHTYIASRALGWDIDYRRLRDWLDASTDLIRPVYHCAVPPKGSQHNPLVGLVRYLSLNGFLVKAKQERSWSGPAGNTRSKDSILCELVTEIHENAEFAGQIVLFAGDGDLTCAVQSVTQRRGVRVVVVSAARTTDAMPDPMVSETLRQAADAFIDLADLEGVIGKPLAAGGTPG